MAWLIQEHGPDPGRTYHLKNSVLTIGRDETNDIPILDGHLSRRHAMIRVFESNFVLDDLSSGNGVFVNGKRLQRRVLHEKDKIQIGTTILVFTLLSPE